MSAYVADLEFLSFMVFLLIETLDAGTDIMKLDTVSHKHFKTLRVGKVTRAGAIKVCGIPDVQTACGWLTSFVATSWVNSTNLCMRRGQVDCIMEELYFMDSFVDLCSRDFYHSDGLS